LLDSLLQEIDLNPRDGTEQTSHQPYPNCWGENIYEV